MSTQQTDPRPPVWVGHITMNTPTLKESTAAMLQVGMRPIVENENIAVLELRGGTHIVLRQDEGTEPIDTEFDFMVEDVDATHAEYAAKGLSVSEIRRGRAFTTPSPSRSRAATASPSTRRTSRTSRSSRPRTAAVGAHAIVEASTCPARSSQPSSSPS